MKTYINTDNTISLCVNDERKNFHIVDSLERIDYLVENYPELKNVEELIRIGDLYNFDGSYNCHIYDPADLDIDFDKLPLEDIDRLAQYGIKVEITAGYSKIAHETVYSKEDVLYRQEQINYELKDLSIKMAKLQDELHDWKRIEELSEQEMQEKIEDSERF